MPTPFGEILAELLGEVRGSQGAILQDWDGETLDYFGHMGPDELCIHAAQWGLVWRMVKYQMDHPSLVVPNEIVIQTSTNKIIITSLFEEYYLVMLLDRDSNLSEALTKIDHFLVEIKEEMGL
jgi:predicted regulator of Ras-like GTPase activity (Roadblock/LC7/MglB family)